MKNKYNIATLFFGLLFIAVFAFRFCKTTATPKDYEQIRQSGILHVVTDSITGQQNEMIIKSLSEYLHIPIEIHLESGLNASIEGLNSGEYDLIARLIPVTSELRETIAFTESLASDKQVLVQRKEPDSTAVFVHSPIELPGKKIYVAQTSHQSRLQNLASEIGDTFQIIEMPGKEPAHLVALVAKRDIDYAVCDYRTASSMLSDYPIIDISTGISLSQLQAWAVRKESPQLLDSINSWIKKAGEVPFQLNIQ